MGFDATTYPRWQGNNRLGGLETGSGIRIIRVGRGKDKCG